MRSAISLPRRGDERSLSVCGMAKFGQSPCFGDGFQDGVVRIGIRIQEILFHLRRDEYRGNSSARGFGESATGVFSLSLIPGKDDEEGFARRFKRGIEFVHLLL